MGRNLPPRLRPQAADPFRATSMSALMMVHQPKPMLPRTSFTAILDGDWNLVVSTKNNMAKEGYLPNDLAPPFTERMTSIQITAGRGLSAHQMQLLTILNGTVNGPPEQTQHSGSYTVSDSIWANSRDADQHYQDISPFGLWPGTNALQLWVPRVDSTAAVLWETMHSIVGLCHPETAMAPSSWREELHYTETLPTASSEYLLTQPAMNNNATDEKLVESVNPTAPIRLDVQKLHTARPKSPRLSDPDDEIVPFLPRNQRPPIVPIGGGRGYVSW